MTLEEFYAKLSFEHLSSVAAGSSGAGEIHPDHQNKVLGFTNSGLIQLYSRFAHKKSYVTLVLDEAIKTYYLSTDYAVSNTDITNTNPRYLADTANDPFKDDLIKILGVIKEPMTDDETQVEIPINDNGDSASVKTLEYNTLYVKEPEQGRNLSVEYQAYHPKLVTDCNDVLAQKIYLSPILSEPLELYVASRVLIGMGGEAHVNRGMALQQLYENLCMRVEAKDTMQVTETDNHDKLTERGFI